MSEYDMNEVLEACANGVFVCIVCHKLHRMKPKYWYGLMEESD